MGNPAETLRVLTAEEIIKIQAWSVVKLPREHMAALLSISVDTFDDIVKRQDAVRTALESGRGQGSINIRQTLYWKAMGKPAEKDAKGKVIKPATPPDFQAMKFWCQTQEGFKTHDVVEFRNGEASALSDEELEERTDASIKRMMARRALRQKQHDDKGE